ncbi:ABC transporter permease [Brachybacterium muris]|uniref:Methionine ABC transporter permease n=1 Tax=Brachybacterium muris UCD-AY4 TaxID=1249481 RepID=A0A022KVI4_9MICO|nr:methionine ABC transporter permease [Brachybacterium muris]PZP16332.1 MAG: ABC transporter permease [Brachybacterium faecium]EYT48672.1 methionine ABC transporter permease [Brachybacterium muris UCD-AY4]MCT1432165.1 ABC transporter permease [Brachybacterium muris]MCT1653641.1 ABC transporter permease [Brachybacterium muris]MCT2260730.1 ABC transporter permease [Brachybacterium muris]
MTEILTNPVFTTWDSNFSLWSNTLITLYMTAGTMLLSTLVGVPLGVALFETSRSPHGLTRWINRVVGFAVNVGRSFPFIILIIALIPVTRFVVGRVTGPNAAMFALTISAIPFLARLIEINLQEVAAGKIEAVRMMGATRFQVIRQVLLPEALPGIIGSLTTTAIAVIGYTAMAGAVGGKGLGDLAIRMGYQSYDNVVMIATVVVLVLIVIALQSAGTALARAVDHRAVSR